MFIFDKNIKIMFKKITIVILGIFIFLAIGFWLFVQSNKPQYSGNLHLENLKEEVNIYFDDIGVPHIYAQNKHDAYIAFGYVHAQDRLWQMELFRRIGAGRLSEIFGKDMIKTDKLFKGLGLAKAAEKNIKLLDTSAIEFKLTQAYLNGINQFIKTGKTPIEYRFAGIEKEEFTIYDVYYVSSYMAFSFAQAFKTDPLLTNLRNKLGDDYMKELVVLTRPERTKITNFNRNSNNNFAGNISKSINKIMNNSPVPPFIGSNSWVIGAKKTKNKKVILANDPHVEFSQPTVWYQSHIITPNFEIYGFNLALTPFPLLGHNRNYAYGMTMFQNDDIDFYEESDNENYPVRTETIKVKSGNSITFKVRDGKHGPIINDFISTVDSGKNISMDWVFTKAENNSLEMSYLISHANSFSDFQIGASKINAPGLNMMYGDAKGNIGWFASAKLFLRDKDVNSKFIIDGSIKYNKVDYLEFNQNPQSINPPWNYVYSANNQPDSIEGVLYPGYYLPEDRALRIESLLKPKNDFTKKDIQNMGMDVTSPVVVKNVKTILSQISKVKLSENEVQVIEILKKWEGNYSKSEVAPVIYNKFLYLFLENTFADEMGEDNFMQFIKTHLSKRQIQKQIESYKSIWWDDITTKNIKENRNEIFTTSFHEAISDLELQFGKDVEDWTWNKALSVTHKHAFDKIPILKSIFNVGPFKTNGGNEVINNHIFPFNGSGKYIVRAGPSTRRIIDFSDVENSVAIIPTGQSGNVFSKHYKNQAQQYLDGEFVKMMLNKNEIEMSEDKLILKPVE